MNERNQDAARSAFEDRGRQLFQDSIDDLDMRVRSRLTHARHAAVEAAAVSSRRPWLFRMGTWTPAGVTAAVLLGAALWFALPAGNRYGMTAADQPSLEDLDIVASADESSADAIEMLQNDLDFYDFADKAANPEPAA
ncbi:MAG: hypothetical protein M3O41_00840 [Pseudomonadota bacterium]|nr:hypothetical protein [Pseudomonadota bacterium]